MGSGEADFRTFEVVGSLNGRRVCTSCGNSYGRK